MLISISNPQINFSYTLSVLADGRVVYRGYRGLRGAAAWQLQESELEDVVALFRQSDFLHWPAEQEEGASDVSLASLTFDDGRKRELRFYPVSIVASPRVCGLTARLFEILDVARWTPLRPDQFCS